MDRNNIYFLLPTLLQERGENISFAPVLKDVATWIKGERVALYADEKARQVNHEISATPEVQALHEATVGIIHHGEAFEDTLDQTNWGNLRKRTLRALFHRNVAANVERMLEEQITDGQEREAASRVMAQHHQKGQLIPPESTDPDFVETLLRERVDAYYKSKK
jgi:hypothetical protein